MATKSKLDAKATIEDLKTKAKTVYTKGAAALGDAKTFTKGNVDAAIESGRILGSGLKDLSEGYVAEGKKAVATFNADVKEFSAVKTPADFFALQTKIIGRNFGSAIDFSSKSAQAVLKLGKDSSAPLTNRVSAAVASVKAA